MATDPDDLAGACLSYLARQEESLRSALATLQEVRAAALAGDAPRLEALRGPQEELARQAQALRAEGAAIRGRAAAVLGVPEAEATLDRLADRLGGRAAEQLRVAGADVRALAAEVDRLNRSNAAVLEHGLSFIRRVLRDLTGAEIPAAGYGPDGTPAGSPSRPLLSARG